MQQGKAKVFSRHVRTIAHSGQPEGVEGKASSGTRHQVKQWGIQHCPIALLSFVWCFQSACNQPIIKPDQMYKLLIKTHPSQCTGMLLTENKLEWLVCPKHFHTRRVSACLYEEVSAAWVAALLREL